MITERGTCWVYTRILMDYRWSPLTMNKVLSEQHKRLQLMRTSLRYSREVLNRPLNVSVVIIHVLATNIFEQILVANTRTQGRGEAEKLSSWWISIGSDLSSLNFNSLIRAEQSFAIHYPNVVIKSLYGNLDICLNYYAIAYFRSRNSVRMLSVANRDRKWKMLL